MAERAVSFEAQSEVKLSVEVERDLLGPMSSRECYFEDVVSGRHVEANDLGQSELRAGGDAGPVGHDPAVQSENDGLTCEPFLEVHLQCRHRTLVGGAKRHAASRPRRGRQAPLDGAHVRG
jgi:hypothetical protein